jgi:hypothetical protein
VGWSALRGEKRDIWEDCAVLAATMKEPAVVSGLEHIPLAQPFVILPNHYERRDSVWVGWGAIAMTNALRSHLKRQTQIRWVMTSTWEDCYVGPRRISPEHLYWVLRRLSRVFGLILMPPDPRETQARSHALRDIFRALSDSNGEIVAMHPEAGGFEDLILPPVGIGRVLSAFDRKGIALVPAGVFENEGRLHVTFAEALPRGSLCRLSDEESATTVMEAIASLVPERMRGPFGAGRAGLTAIAGERMRRYI